MKPYVVLATVPDPQDGDTIDDGHGTLGPCVVGFPRRAWVVMLFTEIQMEHL